MEFVRMRSDWTSTVAVSQLQNSANGFTNKNSCKKNKGDSHGSKQPTKEEVPIEATRNSLSYNSYSPTLSHVEFKDEDSSGKPELFISHCSPASL
jgi:hypothetical protein